MISFERAEDDPELYLIYTPENDDGDWIRHQLETEGGVRLSGRIFHMTKERLVTREEAEEGCGVANSVGLIDDGSFIFFIGVVSASYYIIEREVLGLNFDLSIHVSISLTRKIFAAERNISIFARLNDFGLSELTIGGEEEGAIPKDVFKQLLADFPNSTEVTKYARARIDAILSEYISCPKDFQEDFEKYRNQKRSWKGSLPRKVLAPYEEDKFSALVDKLGDMLERVKDYTENQWQEEILEIILLLFPRYIRAFREGPVKDSSTRTMRNVDFLLVDATGYIDIIEIKKPSFGQLVTIGTGRGNHVPKRALSEAVMQVEKYLYHFNRSGEKGEKILNDKHSSELPDGINIKIVNPSGMIIMGRDNDDLSVEQKNDFEVIRRKYRNVLDIITYDDLLRRLKVIRDQYQSMTGSPRKPRL